MIRRIKSRDIKYALGLWLDEIKKAHYFVSEQYWDRQADIMREEYFSKKECYVYEKNGILTAFILLDEDASILSIVVETDHQRTGIGTELLDHAKKKNTRLYASVAKLNGSAMSFFKKNHFSEQYTQCDVNTKEEEVFFRWDGAALEDGHSKELYAEIPEKLTDLKKKERKYKQLQEHNYETRDDLKEDDHRQSHTALQYLHNAPKGTALGLYSISRILHHLGNPEKDLKFIHVGGTNGKGSTCTFISEMLIVLGYKVGLYISPFLESFNERIQINRRNISDEELSRALEKTKRAVERYISDGNPEPTEFEITTALAYQYYKEQQVDYVVLEVGLGGELDATNTIDPILSVITSISLDHVEYLGDDLIAIAKTKSKIIKPDRPAVLYHQAEELEEQIRLQAEEVRSDLYITKPESIILKSSSIDGQLFDLEVLNISYPNIFITLAGEHQLKNFATALTAIKVLEKKNWIKPISLEQIQKAAAAARWKGRTEILCKEPLTILDGAHNVDGAYALARYIQDFLPDKKKLLVIGMLMDKDVEGVSSLIAPLFDRIVITEPDNPRAMTGEEFMKILSKYSPSEPVVCKKISEAVRYAQKLAEEEGYTILYAGSLYMIGAARTELRQMYGIEE